MAGYAGFTRGFTTGFGLLNAYYANKAARERHDRLDAENQRRWEITNKRQADLADLQTQKLRMEIQDMSLDQAADLYSGIAYDAQGNPVDLSKLTPEEVQAKKAQLREVINRTPQFRSILAQNPEVDPENPLADMTLMYDQKTKQPSAVFTLRMKDGSVRPLTTLRSSDPKDKVVVMPLTEVHNRIMSVLGGRGRLAELDKQARAAAAKASDRRFELQKIDYETRAKMGLEAVKQGYAVGKDGQVHSGGPLAGKRLDKETERLDKFLKTNYGSEGMNGMVSLDGTGQQYSWGLLLGRHLLATGKVDNYVEAGNRAMAMADRIKQAGGTVFYDRKDGWMLWDGSMDENGQKSGFFQLFPGTPGRGARPRPVQAPKTQAAPSFEDYLAQVQAEARKRLGRPLDAEEVQAAWRHYEKQWGNQTAQKAPEPAPPAGVAAAKPQPTTEPTPAQKTGLEAAATPPQEPGTAMQGKAPEQVVLEYQGKRLIDPRDRQTGLSKRIDEMVATFKAQNAEQAKKYRAGQKKVYDAALARVRKSLLKGIVPTNKTDIGLALNSDQITEEERDLLPQIAETL